MFKSDIVAALTEIFHDVFLRDDLTLTPTLSANNVEGWDSFKQIEIVIAVEERFAVKLKTREVNALSNVGDLVAVIASKTSQPNPW